MLRPRTESMQEGAMATTPVGNTSNALDPRGMHPAVTNLEFPEGLRSNQRAILRIKWAVVDEP